MPERLQRLSTNNFILNSLPDADYKRLLPDLEQVDLMHARNIFQPDEQIGYVYFPNTAMISVITSTSDGQAVEAGMIGWEGMAGVEALMGIDSTFNQSMVQIPDGAIRINSAAILKEFNRGGALHQITLRYIHALLMQVRQTALCNRLHSLEQRLSRWLLMCRDRAKSDQLRLTQEFLSIMLGVNRPTVTIAAKALQDAGYIKYSRGRITIISGPALETISCECYQAVKKVWPPASAK